MARLPLRLRLTFWYVALLALTVLLLAAFLHLQLERRLIASTDAVLAVTATQMLSVLDEEGGRPLFEPSEFQGGLPARLDEESFAARLLAPDGGEVWSGLGDFARLPRVSGLQQGYTTRDGSDRGVARARAADPAWGQAGRLAGGGALAGKRGGNAGNPERVTALGAPADPPAGGRRRLFSGRPRVAPDRWGDADRRADQRQRPVAAAELCGPRRRGGAAGAHL